MSLKKVVVHPLERLDIVDVDALQDLAHAAIADVAQGIVGSGTAAGLSRPWTTLTINNTADTIVFSDFSMFLRDSDGDGNSASIPMVYAKYRGSLSGHGDCDFGVAKALAQAYFDDNGSLPPAPGSESFDSSLHGAMYPYIYARPIVGEGSAAARRFWSAADADEISQTVETRTTCVFEFSVVGMLSVPTAPTSGYAWTRIGNIAAWTESGGVVSLASAGVKKFYFSEASLGVASLGVVAQDYHSGMLAGGLTGALAWIMDHIAAMKSNGADDDASRPTINRSDVPPHSMSDMNYRLEIAESDIDTLQARAPQTATVICNLSFPGASPYLPTLTYSLDSGNSFAIVPSLNYRPVRKYILNAHGVSVGAITASEFTTYLSGDAAASQLLGSISISVPEAYRNKRFTCLIEPIYSDQGGTLLGSVDGELSDFAKYQSMRQGEQWFILPDQDSTYNTTRRFTTLTKQSSSSATDELFLGVNIGQRGAVSWADVEAYAMRFDFKITLTALNQ